MRINGTFKYSSPATEHKRDEKTGFIQSQSTDVWSDGCECQVDKSVPAKQIIGSDGQVFAYTYDVFIPPFFNGNLCIGTRVEVKFERGGTDTFTIIGIDDTNPKYIEIWG